VRTGCAGATKPGSGAHTRLAVRIRGLGPLSAERRVAIKDYQPKRIARGLTGAARRPFCLWDGGGHSATSDCMVDRIAHLRRSGSTPWRPLLELLKPLPKPLESGGANVPNSSVVLGAGAKGLLIGLITPGLALNSGFN
jgi:hypothetical protein